jgi:lysozyme family protein
MTASSYDAALARLLVHEGGYTNDAADPGGPTNFGITIYDYRKYVKPDATAADVRAMKVEEAKSIYRAKYWGAQRCDELPAGVDDSIFDYGVNSGIGRSGKVLRRVLGLPDSDWKTSDEVLAALAKRDPKAVIIAINDERLRFLQSLRTWPVFGRGWGARVAEVKTFSLQLAASGSAALPVPAPDIQQAGKGVVPLHPALKTAVENKKILAQTSAPISAGGGFAAWDWIKVHPAEAAALGIVIVGGVAIAGYAIERWHKSQQEAATPGMVPVPVAA